MTQVIAAVGEEAQNRLANAPPWYESDEPDADDQKLAAD
jgi:hypothetical protein